MSTSAYWKPVAENSDSFTNEMKHALERGYGSHFTLDAKDLSWLEGVRDAGVKGAEDVIEAVLKYESIEVTISC